MDDRELDAWLAEHLFGLEVEWDYWFPGSDGGKRSAAPSNRDKIPFEVGEFDCLPSYSSTGDGMLLVLEAMRERRQTLLIDATYDEKQWWVKWGEDKWHQENAVIDDSLPRAVALAAKAAIEASA